MKAVAASTVTLTAAEPEPLYGPPVQLREYVAVPTAVGVTLSVPLADLAPVQPPEAVQEVPSLAVQESVVL
jgi:hypothetical protein